MRYGYCRCSTNDTMQDTARQERYCEANQCDRVYHEYVSGIKENRKEYLKMLSMLEEGDEICCTEVSRLSRSVQQLLDLLTLAKEKHLRIICGGLDIDCRKGSLANPMLEGVFLISSVFASLERQITSERVKSGLQTARAKGKVLGRPHLTVERILEHKTFMRFYPQYKAGNLKLKEICQLCQLSPNTIYRYCERLERETDATH